MSRPFAKYSRGSLSGLLEVQGKDEAPAKGSPRTRSDSLAQGSNFIVLHVAGDMQNTDIDTSQPSSDVAREPRLQVRAMGLKSVGVCTTLFARRAR